MLEVTDICVRYGATQVLWDVVLNVGDGEIVAVMGPNGSGKSTIFKAIMGLVPSFKGSIRIDGNDVTPMRAETRIGCGVSMVLERRRLFPLMTVRENVLMGAYHPSARASQGEMLEWVNELFPIVAERANQLAERLSGGEQQMVAIARGLMSRPRLLILDEPFLGLTPKMVGHVVEIIRTINRKGIAVLFNEQNVRTSFENAHRGYVLESGRVVASGSGLEMLEHPDIRRVYLGV